MLKITTWNVNGVRARQLEVAIWLEREQPDVLCLQELKAAPDRIPPELLESAGYVGYFHGHKGYSGVSLQLKRSTFGDSPRFEHPHFDHETRIVVARASGLALASIYVPNGGKSLEAKVRFLDAMHEFAEQEQQHGTQLVLCGDLNVALEERDVHPTLRKPEQIGQTPAERGQLARIIGAGLCDLSRKFHPDDDRLFSWWAPWRNMRAKNIGWRLDYVLCSEQLAARAKSCEVAPAFGTSDHAPVTALFELDVQPTSHATEPASTAPPRAGQLPLF